MDANKRRYDVIILGSGPAGVAAAVYASRAALSTLVIDSSTAAGQVEITHLIANYAGFVEPVPGYELAGRMWKQAERHNTHFLPTANTTALKFNENEKWAEIDDQDRYSSRFVMIATDASPRLSGIPGERQYTGNGISYCAICDAEFFADKITAYKVIPHEKVDIFASSAESVGKGDHDSSVNN